MYELGAYLPIYKNLELAERTVKSFRNFYPKEPFYLLSDNGLDFSDLAKKYDCYYEHSDVNTGINPYLSKESFSIQQNRFKRAFEYCCSDYVIYLEDDVLIRKKICIDPTVYIAGVMVGNIIPQALIKYLEDKYRCKFEHNQYGACGGALLKRQTYIDNFNIVERFIKEDLDIVIECCNRIIAGDMLMVVLYTIFGYTYKKNNEIVEVLRDSSWRNSSHAIVHQLKHNIV
jgi:hypothetical protein